jgi:hypothetical protein
LFKRKILRGESFDLDEEEEESAEDELRLSEEESEEQTEESSREEDNNDDNEPVVEMTNEAVVETADLIEIDTPEEIRSTPKIQEKIRSDSQMSIDDLVNLINLIIYEFIINKY